MYGRSLQNSQILSTKGSVCLLRLSETQWFLQLKTGTLEFLLILMSSTPDLKGLLYFLIRFAYNRFIRLKSSWWGFCSLCWSLPEALLVFPLFSVWGLDGGSPWILTSQRTSETLQEEGLVDWTYLSFQWCWKISRFLCQRLLNSNRLWSGQEGVGQAEGICFLVRPQGRQGLWVPEHTSESSEIQTAF